MNSKYTLFSIFLLFSCKQINYNYIKYVNPLIGTNYSTTPSALKHQEFANENKGQTFPAVGIPHAQTQWTPQTRATEQKCIAPYYYQDSTINGFRGSHWMSGSCTQDYGSVSLMPLGAEAIMDAEKRASVFSRGSETSTPAFYQVTLKRYDVTTQLTAANHSAILQFTFATAGKKHILIEPNSDEGKATIEVSEDGIAGSNPVHRIYQGWGEYAGFDGHFYVQFDQPWDQVFIEKQQLEKGIKTFAFAVFDVKAGETIKVKIGHSFTSIAKAKENLTMEIPDFNFDRIRMATERQWEEKLGQIAVVGTDKDSKTMFYSALYHSKMLPRVFNDVDGTYPGFANDDQIHRARGYDYYVDFATWDTFRAVHPLMTILEPDRSTAILNSIVKKAEQGQWLPIFPCWNNYTAAMIGDHLISVVGDAYLKGITDFDVDKAYAYMRKNAFEIPKSKKEYMDGKGRRALDSYLKYGYVPLEDSVKEAFHKNEQVSRTLEYAYDDHVLSLVAKKLGKFEDAKKLTTRALNYQNVFDTSTGFVRGRHKDGSWAANFDPYQRQTYITEGTPYQYTFYIPHDIDGLVKLIGGQQKFIEKLDTFFAKEEYWHGNEPSHHIAYLYAIAGAAWKTQKNVRKIIYEEYDNSPGGISGNDDAGQMSAWLVFSMMGFYPVSPGDAIYIIGSPVFDQLKINLQKGKTFTIVCHNNSKSNMYIQNARINGKPMNRTYFSHQELLKGVTIELTMGPEPNKKWPG